MKLDQKDVETLEQAKDLAKRICKDSRRQGLGLSVTLADQTVVQLARLLGYLVEHYESTDTQPPEQEAPAETFEPDYLVLIDPETVAVAVILEEGEAMEKAEKHARNNPGQPVTAYKAVKRYIAGTMKCLEAKS